MIQLQINPNAVKMAESVILLKTKQAEEIIKPTSLSEIAKAVFTITAKRFLQDLSQTAIQDQQKYHHLYEWTEVGHTQNKLFKMRRSNIQYGKLIITFDPMKSTKPVPIDSALLLPGKTGKIVNSHHIFRDKMRIMEENIPVHYQTKRTIVFNEPGEGLVFVPKGHVIDIMNPGGTQTTNALKNYSEYWYDNVAPDIVYNSNLIKQIGNEVVKTINTPNCSFTRVRDTIRKVVSAYSKELVEI